MTATHTTISHKRIFGLDLMRSLAILFVLFAHTLPMLGFGTTMDSIEGFCTVWGVEIFFVLSGFLIGTILIKIHYQENSTTFRSVKMFWIRRWFRTLPNYYLMLLVYAGLYFLSKHELIFKDLNHAAYFVFLQNAVTYHPADFFRLAWSLSVEEWFYLTFPLVLLLMQVLIKNKYVTIFNTVLCFVIICLLLRIGLALRYNPAWDEGFRKIMPLRLDSIAIGVLAALVKFRYPEKWKKNARKSGLAGFIILAGLIVLFHYEFSVKFNFRSEKELAEIGIFLKTFFFTINSLAIALLLPYFYYLKTSPTGYINRVVTYTSTVSYSMYLLHPAIIMIIYRFSGGTPGIINFILTWVVVYIGSGLQYHFFEKRMTALRDKIGNKKDAVGVLG